MGPVSSAVLIGVTEYRDPSLAPLPCAAHDVDQLSVALEAHRDGSLNFEVHPRVVGDNDSFTAGTLLADVEQQLDDCEHFLFYFSGHGVLNSFGLQLATPEKEHPNDSGVYFDALLHRFNQTSTTEVTVILDCCFAGAAGDRSFDAASNALKLTHLREGVSILASSGRNQASEGAPDGPSVFTKHVLDCLSRTDVTAVSVLDLYTWTSRNLPNQIPMLRTFGSQYSAIRAESLQAALDLS